VGERGAQLPARLWRVPVYLPYLQPKLTPRAVAAAEKKLGVRLPRTYIEAIQIQNGGHLRKSAHPSDHAPVSWIAGIGPRFPSILGHDWGSVKECMAEQGFTKPARIDELIPFHGDGHYYYCLDYRQSGPDGEPCVTYIDVECFNIDEVLAPDFHTFLIQLRTEEQAEVIGLITRAPMARVATAVSKASGFVFEDRGDQVSGYRVFRAKLPGNANWAWLTPNRVRHGFVRRGTRDYAALHGLLPDRVDRYPEHPDCAYVLRADFTSKAGRAIVRALDKLPFATRRLLLEDD
jgi:hypothetical protein